MRKHLEELSNKVDLIDTDNLYQAVADIKEVLTVLIVQLDQALPVDKSNDV